jgi:hypothetical protein
MYAANTVYSNLFFLSLFTRVSDHGIIYSVPTNHRHANNRTLLSVETNQQSLVHHAFGTGNNSVFSTNPVSIMFYEEKALLKTSDEGIVQGCRIKPYYGCETYRWDKRENPSK